MRMKRNIIKILVLSIFIMVNGCGENRYHLVDAENPLFKDNTAFLSFEDLTSPKFEALKEKYQLDTVFKGETDEFKRILLLRHWIKSVIRIEDYKPHYSGGGHADRILDAALQGEGFDCGHFMTVQNAIMNAYGYVTRCLGAGAGQKGIRDGHHGINEIWLNDFNKWFLSDAKYDHHFEKDGIPLSALEVRDEYIKNKGLDILKVKGPDRTPLDFDEEMGWHKERFVETYTWISWDTYIDRYTSWPNFRTMLNMYKDEYFNNNIWIRGGKPHWAYNTEYLQLVDDRDAIEWTPNTIATHVKITDHAEIEIKSTTPNLKEYQIKYSPDDQWQSVEDKVKIKLNKKRHTLSFRAVNLAGVAGPEHKLVLHRN
jgi:hypothetical protein